MVVDKMLLEWLELRSWFEKKYKSGQANGLLWSRLTHDAVEKKFGTLKNIVYFQLVIGLYYCVTII